MIGENHLVWAFSQRLTMHALYFHYTHFISIISLLFISSYVSASLVNKQVQKQTTFFIFGIVFGILCSAAFFITRVYHTLEIFDYLCLMTAVTGYIGGWHACSLFLLICGGSIVTIHGIDDLYQYLSIGIVGLIGCLMKEIISVLTVKTIIKAFIASISIALIRIIAVSLVLQNTSIAYSFFSYALVLLFGYPIFILLLLITILREKNREIYKKNLSHNESRYQMVFEYSPSSLWELDLSTIKNSISKAAIKKMKGANLSSSYIKDLINQIIIIETNHRSLELFGAPSKDQLIRIFTSLFTEKMQQSFLDMIDSLLTHRYFFKTETEIQRFDGTIIAITAYLIIVPGCEKTWNRAILTLNDITKQKQFESMQKNTEIRTQALLYLNQKDFITLGHILDYALDTALTITQSSIGYIYFYNADLQEFHLYAWSKTVMDQCAVVEPQTVYHLSKTGLWGEVVRQRKAVLINDYHAPHQLKKGIPQGHVELKRFLSIPVFDDNTIVAVVGVANKDELYTEDDINHLTLLMDGVWKLKLRKDMQKQIQEMNTKLEVRVKNRTQELEKALSNLKKSEEKYKSLILNINDGFFITDCIGTIIFANLALARIHGYETDHQMIGQNIGDLVVARERERVIQKFNQFITNTTDFEEIEVMIQDTEGLEKILSIKASLVYFDDHFYGTQGVVRDITDRKIYENSIKQQNEFLSSIIESINHPFFVLDCKDFSILSANTSGKKALEQNNIICNILSQENLGICEEPSHKCVIKEILETKSPAVAEHVRLIDGQINCTELHVHPIFDEYNNIDKIILYIFDITHRKVAEKKLTETLTELERSNRELSQFAYIASHDLQEPLRVITNYLQLIQKRYEERLDEKGIDFIQRTIKAAKRLQTIINDLLIYARISSNSAQFSNISAQTLVDRAIDNLHIAIRHSDVLITHDDLPIIYADENQLVSVFTNLIGNAVKYRQKDTAVKIHISYQQNECSWQFGIHDNGIGIDERYFHKLFEIFQRLHTNDEYPGTGIGLASCKKIIERHGGKIWVDSVTGSGSTFYFTIPFGS